MGNGDKFSQALAAVCTVADTLLDACVPSIRHEFIGKDHSVQKRELAIHASIEVNRLREGLSRQDGMIIRSAKRAMAGIGETMVLLSAELELAGDRESAAWRSAAHPLHVADIEQSQEASYLEEMHLLDRVSPLVERLLAGLAPNA
jgi:hypothetical protein